MFLFGKKSKVITNAWFIFNEELIWN